MKLIGLAVVMVFVGACGGSPSVAGHSPTSRPSLSASSTASPSGPGTGANPRPVNGAFGVLYGSQAATDYTVAIVGVDGKVVASAQASTPPSPNCANAAAALVAPPLSASDTRVYFEDGQGTIHYLGPAGDGGTVTTVPAPTSTRRSMFAVSPDDARIAVIVDDFTSAGASTRLYAEDLIGGGHHVELFSETGAYTLWPTGWHGANNLVVAKVPSCTQGGGPTCCGPQELHVVDPATAARRFIIGGSGCVVAGPATPGGVMCENSAFTQAIALNWTAGTIKTYPIQGPIQALISPDGSQVAFVGNNGTTVSPAIPLSMVACGWIDDQHLLAGGDPLHQPQIGEVPSGVMVPVAAQGDCGGRIPGGL